MKRTTSICTTILAAISISSASSAQLSQNVPSPMSSGFCGETFSHPRWDVFYVNGINATPEKSRERMIEVRKTVEERYSTYIEECDEPNFPATFTFQRQYNPSQGKFKDAIETIQVIGGNSYIQALRRAHIALGGRLPFEEQTIPLAPLNSEEYETLLLSIEPAFVNQTAQEWADSLNGTSTNGAKRCPLVIGYSQGTIMTNRAFLQLETIQDPDCTSLIHIGSVANVIYGEASNYITLEEDAVVELVRLNWQNLSQEPLPANVNNEIFQEPQELGHGLVPDYIQGGNSRNRIHRSLDNSVFCNTKGSLGIALPSTSSTNTCPYLQ